MADVEDVEGAEGDHGLAGHVNCSPWIAPLDCARSARIARFAQPTLEALPHLRREDHLGVALRRQGA